MPRNGLALHRALIRSALSLTHVYAWLLMFQLFYVRDGSVSRALISVVLTYALVQVFVVLLTPFSAAQVRHGFRRLLILATIALSISLATLAATFSGLLGNIGIGIAVASIFLGVYRALYWVPYEVARETSPNAKPFFVDIAIALMPAIGGLYLTNGPTAAVALLYAGAVIVLMSILPLTSMREAHEGFAWKYRESFHELFAPERRHVLWNSVLAGAEATVLLVLWPITIFMLLQWSYLLVGVTLSLTFIFTMIARRIFSKQLAEMPRRMVPFIVVSGWLMRLGVSGFVGAVLVDTFTQTGAHPLQRGVDAQALEHVADNRTFVDEYTALKEMGMALGRIAICILVAILALYLRPAIALAISFVIAAVCVGSMYFYSKSIEGERAY